MKKVKWLATVLVVASIVLGVIGCSSPSGPSGSGNGGAQQGGANGDNHGEQPEGGTQEVVIPKGFVLVKGTTITGTESWTPSSKVFVSGLTIPDLIVCDHEVTRGEYKALMKSDPSWPTHAYDKDGKELEDDAALNNPVSCVSWCYAIAYCNKLSMQEKLTPCYTINSLTNPDDWGKVPSDEKDPSCTTWDAATCDFKANGYRLPTEAEWEWLARGGQNYEYAGSDKADDVAWSRTNTDYTGTRDVKTKAPNGYGLYDMSGNVREWCWDKKDVAFSDIDGRVLRGGSWGDFYHSCTVYDCFDDFPSTENLRYGFRVVRQAN